MNRVQRWHPGHRRISRAITIVTIFVIATKVVAALREVVIAQRYGTSSVVDAFMFVLNTVTWPNAVWTGLLGIVLVPIFVRDDHENSVQFSVFSREVFGFTIIVSAILTLAIGITLWILVNGGGVSLSKDARIQALAIILPMTLLVPLMFANTLFAQRIMSQRRQSNSLFEGLPPLFTLICVLLIPTTTPLPLVLGVIGGFAFQFVALIASQRSLSEWLPPAFSFRSPIWPRVWKGFAILASGLAIMSFTTVLDQFMAAALGEGSIAILGYANRLLALITSLGATAVSRAVLPVLSHMVVTKEDGIRKLTAQWAIFMFVAGFVIIMAGWWLTPHFVSALFERGKFTAADSAGVSVAVQYGLMQMPFYFSGLVISQFLASRVQIGRIVLINIVCGITKVIANLLLVPTFGIRGLMFATALMYVVSLAIHVYFLLTQTRQPSGL